MDQKVSAYCGCLLGLAVGDAMGYPVDKKSWDEICEDYGPNGLLGYDLVNGGADVTSYTQLAAFVCNSLLLSANRANPALHARYLLLGLREWAKSQQFRTTYEKTFCWIGKIQEMRRRYCMDTRMLDALTRQVVGTPEQPVIRSSHPGMLTAALAVGLCHEGIRLEPEQIGRLGMEAVAYTHGDPDAFLSGAFLAVALSRILQQPTQRLIPLYEQICEDLENQLSADWPQIKKLTALIRQAIAYTRDAELSPLAAMTMLGCTTAAECTAAAVYATIIHMANFDEAMIVSVNHSGRSAAVGAITGALLGARLGVTALPEFYLESLEVGKTLTELAVDLTRAKQTLSIFDDTWDLKYVQGLPAN